MDRPERTRIVYFGWTTSLPELPEELDLRRGLEHLDPVVEEGMEPGVVGPLLARYRDRPLGRPGNLEPATGVGLDLGGDVLQNRLEHLRAHARRPALREPDRPGRRVDLEQALAAGIGPEPRHPLIQPGLEVAMDPLGLAQVQPHAVARDQRERQGPPDLDRLGQHAPSPDRLVLDVPPPGEVHGLLPQSAAWSFHVAIASLIA